ncbi:glucosamine 6-phosphate N-acetyltransferase isoform X2 [Protopterus annectens]|uniref:glucosamine 6-phosphate N-acetyltransferase isoform X2 n=1 Tax=Protopterus annectens TaxID=7888 RepID=UPI001CFA9917|nr:glucosamine 6-phosphate N-acetyltransferase isoform X2 [Protopterus annectens]
MLLDETPLFDPRFLQELDWSQNTASFSPVISPLNPGEGLVLRPLCTADFNRGFFKVLSQLTEVGEVTPEQFIKKFEHMKKSGDYYSVVVEDTGLGHIVATATLIIEHKFIHSCAKFNRESPLDHTDPVFHGDPGRKAPRYKKKINKIIYIGSILLSFIVDYKVKNTLGNSVARQMFMNR